jgi:hypothetical protein
VAVPFLNPQIGGRTIVRHGLLRGDASTALGAGTGRTIDSLLEACEDRA